MVVELDVGQERDLDVQAEHRAVGLVGLHHEPLAAAPLGVLEAAADRPRRSASRAPCRRRAGCGRASRRSSSCRGCPPRRSSAAARSARPAARRAGARGCPVRRAARRSTFSAGTAEEYTSSTPSPAGHVLGAVPDAGPQHAVGGEALEVRRAGRVGAADLLRRARARRARSRSCRRRRPRRSASAAPARARPAALIRAPPPAARRRSPAAACGRARRAARRRHRAQALGVAEQLGDLRARGAPALSSPSAITTAAPASAIQRALALW